MTEDIGDRCAVGRDQNRSFASVYRKTSRVIPHRDVHRLCDAERRLAEEYLEDNAGQDSELVFTPEFLADPEHIAAGKEVWQGQYALCHGAKA